MNKVYHLSTCDTCKRILKEVDPDNKLIRQDIKTEKITVEQLEEMRKLASSHEALFSRVARKYRELNLKEKQLSEDDYKNFILEEYTFLKRPVFILESEIFIGNSKKNIAAVAEKMASL